MGASTSHELDRTTFALATGVVSLLWVAANQGSGGRSIADRIYYRAIREHVSFAAPAWLFGPAWTLWILAIAINTILFANNPITEANESFYQAEFWLFLGWVLLFSIWTPLFFGLRQTLLAFFDSLLLLCTTVALIVVQVKGGETRLGIVYGLLIPIAAWLLYATILTLFILGNQAAIASTEKLLRAKEAMRAK